MEAFETFVTYYLASGTPLGTAALLGCIAADHMDCPVEPRLTFGMMLSIVVFWPLILICILVEQGRTP